MKTNELDFQRFIYVTTFADALSQLAPALLNGAAWGDAIRIASNVADAAEAASFDAIKNQRLQERQDKAHP